MSGGLGDVCINLVEYQVNELMGGILGGRELEIVPCDSRSTTAGCVACARQMLYEEDVAAVLWGGFTAADANAIVDFSEENDLPYFFWGGIPLDLCAKKFCVRNTLAMDSMMTIADDVMKLLNPKTVAGLAYDTTDGRAYMSGWLAKFEAAGVEVLYEEYHPTTTTDFTPYLTTIKHLNPDLLMIVASNEAYVAMAKQIVGLGGLGDTEFMCDPPAEIAMGEEGAQGWYIRTLWYPGLPYPGAKKLEEDYYALYKSSPITYLVFYYNCCWSAINAIELAGTTDRIKVAEAARSGNLEWESPVGTFHFTTCGEPGHIPGLYVQIRDKKIVPVPVPE
jgi:branched-chain amino acid transport system substrate-binding protein